MTTLASGPVKSASVKRARMISRPLQYIALVLYMIFLGFPLLFLLTTAFKTPRELQSPNPGFLPTTFDLQNFEQAIEKANLFTAAGNSLIVAVSTTVLVTIIALPAAYALARFRTRLRGIATGVGCAAVVAVAAALIVQTAPFDKEPTTPQRVPDVNNSEPLSPISFIRSLRPDDPDNPGVKAFTVRTNAATPLTAPSITCLSNQAAASKPARPGPPTNALIELS